MNYRDKHWRTWIMYFVPHTIHYIIKQVSIPLMLRSIQCWKSEIHSREVVIMTSMCSRDPSQKTHRRNMDALKRLMLVWMVSEQHRQRDYFNWITLVSLCWKLNLKKCLLKIINMFKVMLLQCMTGDNCIPARSEVLTWNSELKGCSVTFFVVGSQKF